MRESGCGEKRRRKECDRVEMRFEQKEGGAVRRQRRKAEMEWGMGERRSSVASLFDFQGVQRYCPSPFHLISSPPLPLKSL